MFDSEGRVGSMMAQSEAPTVTVLGLDPGSRRLGFGLIEARASSARRLASGTIRLRAEDPLAERLRVVYHEVTALFARHRPDCVAVEECFVAQGVKAALVLGQVRGVLLLAVAEASLRLSEHAPRAVKLAAVGRGGATKEQVQYMVPRILADCPTALDPDEADALAVAWCGAVHLRTQSMLRPPSGAVRGATR